MTLKTEDNLFMSYEYHSLFGLIRISKEAVYIFSIYNKYKHNGAFKDFMQYIEKSKKPIIFLNVRNSKFWHHLSHNGYRPHSGEVLGTDIIFKDSLIKYPKNENNS